MLRRAGAVTRLFPILDRAAVSARTGSVGNKISANVLAGSTRRLVDESRGKGGNTRAA